MRFGIRTIGFTADGGFCSAVDSYPNATVAEYGVIKGAAAMQAEIHTRGCHALALDPPTNSSGLTRPG